MRARLIIFIALVFALGLAVAVVRRAKPSIAVETSAVTRGSIARQVLATATLAPSKAVEVGTQVSGTIASLPVDFNSVVSAGQVIARIDPAIYKSQLESARGALRQAQAEAAQARTALADAQVKFKRAGELASRDLVTPADLDTARVTLQQAQADLRSRDASVKAARAKADAAEVDLAHTVIRSPIDGIVVNRNVDIGQTVAAAFQSPVLFTIADLSHMQLLTEINEGEIGGVGPGSRVSFHVDSLGPVTFEGTVAAVRLQPYAESTGAVATSGSTAGTATATNATGSPAPSGAANAGPPSTTGSTGTGNAASTTSGASASGSSSTSAAPGAVSYTAVVDVDNSDGRLTPGTTAVVTITSGERRDIIRVPNQALAFTPSPALLERAGQKEPPLSRRTESSSERAGRTLYVWRFERNRFEPLPVRTGLSDDRWTELVSGPVQPGDELVIAAK